MMDIDTSSISISYDTGATSTDMNKSVYYTASNYLNYLTETLRELLIKKGLKFAHHECEWLSLDRNDFYTNPGIKAVAGGYVMKNNNFEWTKENPGIIAVAGGGYVLKLLENNFEWTKDVIPTASQAVLEVYRAERRHRKNMRRCRWLIDDLAKDNVVIPTRKYQKKILIKESDLIIALRRDQDVERDQCLQITAMESGFIRNANAQNFHEMLTDVLQHIVGEL